MVNLSFNKRTIEELKQRIDARDIARTLLGSGKHHRKYDLYRSPFRDDGDNADFAVYKEGYTDFGGDAKGDVFSLVKFVQNCTFPEAFEYVQHYAGGTSASPAPQTVSRPTTGISEPPSAEWQRAAQAELETSQNYLWSGKSDALQALAYLHSQTLTDDTIRAFGLGFNPVYRKFKGGDLPAGIVIPVWAGGVLWRLSVRTNNPKRKYQNATGSKLGGLFNADAIQPGKPVLMVEGEKDVIVAQQALGNLATAVTLGGVSSKLSNRWRDQLQAANKIFITYDNDLPGQTAALELKATLTRWGIQVQALTIPAGKDATEYVSEHGGNLRAWFEASIHVSWWPGQGVPDSVRRALNEYFPRPHALVIELLNEAAGAGLINASDYMINEILAANTTLGYNIPESTLKRILQSPEFEFISVLETVLDGSLMSKTEIYSDNGSKRGRKPIHYCCVSVAAFMRIILNYALPRIYEEAHPVHTTDPVMAQVTASIMRDAVETTEDYDKLASEVNRITLTAFKKQDVRKQRAGKRAVKYKQQLLDELKDTTSTPLPVGWPKSNATEYRAAFAHVFLKAHPGLIASRQDMSHMLDVSNGALSGVIAAAGGKAEQQFAAVKLTDATDLQQQIQQARSEVKGYPRYVMVGEGDTLKKFAYDPDDLDEIKHHLQRGAVVNMTYQTANRYNLERETPIVKEVVTKPRVTKIDNIIHEGKNPCEFKPFYGPKYNPAWIIEQLRLMLVGLGWKKQDGNLVNPDTGEMLNHTATPRELIEALLNRQIAPSHRETYRGMLAAEMASLGYRKAVTSGLLLN